MKTRFVPIRVNYTNHLNPKTFLYQLEGSHKGKSTQQPFQYTKYFITLRKYCPELTSNQRLEEHEEEGLKESRKKIS